MTTKEIKKDEKLVTNSKKKGFLKVFSKKHIFMFLFLLAMTLSYTHVAYATPTPAPTSGTAEQKWEDVINFLLPWIGRLGGVVALWGGVELGMALKDDDASGKAKGMKWILAGVVIIAVRFSASIFLLN